MTVQPAFPFLELETLPGAGRLVEKDTSWWMDAPGLDVVAAARLLLARGARLVTITAAAGEDSATTVIYHYALKGDYLHLKISVKENLPSITPVMPAAGWIEREIMDLFAVNFEGHPEPGRLVRPAQLTPGFFRRPGGAAGRSGPSAS